MGLLRAGSRNQLAAAGPDGAADEQCSSAPACAPSRSTFGDQGRCQAWRDVLVLPIGPGVGPRQVPVGADADAGNQQHEDHDRPDPQPVAAHAKRRQRRPTDRAARRRNPGSGRRPLEGTSLVLTTIDGHAILTATIAVRAAARLSRRQYRWRYMPATPGRASRGRHINGLLRCASAPASSRALCAVGCTAAVSQPPGWTCDIDGVVGLRLGAERLDRELGRGERLRVEALCNVVPLAARRRRRPGRPRG